MNSSHNIPVHLEFREDGTVFAKCLLFDCECSAPSRMQALRTILRLAEQFAAKGLSNGQKYEVIFIAVTQSLKGAKTSRSDPPKRIGARDKAGHVEAVRRPNVAHWREAC